MAGPQGMSKEVVYIVIAVVCGMFGLWQVNAYVEERLAEYRSQLTDTIQVVTLNKTIGVNGKITTDIIEMAEVPQAFKIDKRAVRWNDRNKVMDRTVNSAVEKGEILMWYAMEMGGAASIKDKIPSGQKAVTIPINLLQGSAGMLRPNMSVDLYWIQSIKAKHDGQDNAERFLHKEKDLEKEFEYDQVQLVKENVTIVATDAKTTADSVSNNEDGVGYGSITILVESSEVEKFLIYTLSGKLVSVLRSEMDGKSNTPSKPLTTIEVQSEWFNKGQNAIKERLESTKAPEAK